MYFSISTIEAKAMRAKIDADAVHAFGAGNGGEAIELAKRMARYGRRYWVVWWLKDGSYKAAKLTQKVMELAMSEAVGSKTRPGMFYAYEPNIGTGMFVGQNLQRVWLSNMKHGHFSYGN